MASPKSKQRQVADDVIAAFNAWDIERIMAYRSDDCTQQVLPKSLGREPMDNATYRAFFSTIIPYFTGFTVTVHELIEDEKERKIMMWACSASDSVIGPYNNEYSLILYFNEEGDKVVKFLEFVDSARSSDFFPRLRAWVEEHTKSGESQEAK